MDLTNKRTIKFILKRYKLLPKKGLGQNFLIEKEAILDLIRAAEIKKEDTILEIGPGLGTLTKELCKLAKRVIGVEKDKRLADFLKDTYKDYNNLEIINDDILKIDLQNIIKEEYKVVSSLPFYISSPLFRKFLEGEGKPKEMTLIVQREIAEKVVAKPGRLSILGVFVQIYAEPSLVKFIKCSSFWPKPKVEAAILKLYLLENPRFDIESKKFFRIVKGGFGERRKKLINSLSGGLALSRDFISKILEEIKIKNDARAEDLSLEEWYKLYQKLKDVL